jgi:RNA-directed DNA polymerase
MNNSELLKVCEGLSKTSFHKTKIICLFDRDDSAINKKVAEEGKQYKHWGNNVYSVLLPIPHHRSFDKICIEHFYTDSELMTVDKHGRRIFLSTEFDKDTRKHNSEDLFYPNKYVLQSKYPKILDSLVFNEKGKNVALTKNDFADNIMNKAKGFDKITFTNFKPIFEIFDEIIKI